MAIMCREAEDAMSCLCVANGMEAAGARVVSITSNGQSTYVGALAPHTRFIVWAQVENDLHIDRVDLEIGKEYNAHGSQEIPGR